jgi:hypothetical protein
VLESVKIMSIICNYVSETPRAVDRIDLLQETSGLDEKLPSRLTGKKDSNDG